MNSAKTFRVVIVDDLPAIRQDAEYLLKKWPEFIVVGSCGSVHDALVLISACRPDILLLDIRLDDGTAFDILEQVSYNKMKIILLTGYKEYAIKAIKYGVIDYLLKPICENEFREKLLIRSFSPQPQQLNLSHFWSKKKNLRSAWCFHRKNVCKWLS